MKRVLAPVLASVALTLLAAAGSTAVPAKADGVTPAQLMNAGWTCIQPHNNPALMPARRPASACRRSRRRLASPTEHRRMSSWSSSSRPVRSSAPSTCSGPTSSSTAHRLARNSPVASTSTTRGMTSGSATGWASTRPPDRPGVPRKITVTRGRWSRVSAAKCSEVPCCDLFPAGTGLEPGMVSTVACI